MGKKVKLKSTEVFGSSKLSLKMNRMTKIQNQNKINERELKLGITGNLNKSWHQDYTDSAWVYIGGLSYDLNEGDIITVFSQYGEVVNINLIRDSKTGKSKGFAFLCYQDQRSTILAVDNFNGAKVAGRVIQVDHCHYKVPKYKESVPQEIRELWEKGCAPQPINVPEDVLKSRAKEEKKEKKKKLKEFESLVPLPEDENNDDFRRERRRLKKERKEMKKMEKIHKKMEKRLREPSPDANRKGADAAGRWDDSKKKLDDADMLNDEMFYGANDHFNFGKKRKELPPPPTHNVRPDFDKADWRDIEIFKLIREKERQEKGEKPNHFKEEEHYVPQRLGK